MPLGRVKVNACFNSRSAVAIVALAVVEIVVYGFGGTELAALGVLESLVGRRAASKLVWSRKEALRSRFFKGRPDGGMLSVDCVLPVTRIGKLSD